MTALQKYGITFRNMKAYLIGKNIQFEEKSFGNLTGIDIIINGMYMAELIYFVGGVNPPYVSLHGGANAPLFHHDGRKVSIHDGFRRFMLAMDMLIDGTPNNDIEMILRHDIETLGR